MWHEREESSPAWRPPVLGRSAARSAPRIVPQAQPKDVLSDLLRAVRLPGAMMYRGDLTAPWALASPEPAQLASMLSPGARQLALFHVVAEGRCSIGLVGGPQVHLECKDVVVFPYGDQHTMGSDGAHVAVPVGALLQTAQKAVGLPVVSHGGGGEVTRLVCGYVLCDELTGNPLLKTLPPLLHLRASAQPADSLLEATVQQLIAATYASQAGSVCLRDRLAELLFIEALRQHIVALPQETTGWIGALSDPMVGRALQLLHARPAERWSVDSLARQVGTSRSVLGTRFKTMLGQPPMRYLTCSRLQLAAQLLREGKPGIAAVAARVGYESEPAFNRAFKRRFGEPPATWRTREQGRGMARRQ